MTKHHWRESLISFFGSHIDPDKDEQLKGIKTEIDEMVKRILKLIESEDLEENDEISANSKKEAVSDLVKEFYEQYESLYTQYDHLTGELRKNFHGKREKESSSSSSSESDSDDSSKGKSKRNGKVDNKLQRMDGMKQEVETADLEVADLKRTLTAVAEEKEALDSEYQKALSKIKEGEEIIRNLKLDAERLDAEKMKLLDENGELCHKLETAGKIEEDLSHKLEDLTRKKNELAIESENADKRIQLGQKIAEDLKTEVERLKDKIAALTQDEGILRKEASDLRWQLQSAEQQISDLRCSLNTAEEENKNLSSKNLEISAEMQQKQNVIQELEAESRQVKENLSEKEREIFSVSEIHEVHKKESAARIKELEAQVTSMELELESLRGHNKDMELQITSKISEAEELAEQNQQLKAEVSELELALKERGDELCAFTSKLEDKETESLSRIENLTSEVNSLRAEMSSLSALKAEMEEQMVSRSGEVSTLIKGLENQLNSLQEELGSLHSQKAELELQLEKKSQEISEYLTQTENLKAEIVNKTANQERILEEHNTLSEKLKGLELELQSQHGERSELEEQLRIKIEENGELREEKVGLQDKISQLEKVLAEKGLELSALYEKHLRGENEASAQTTALTEKIHTLQQDLDSLQTQKTEMEMELEKEKREKSLLLSRVDDQQRTLIEQEVACNKLSEEYKQIEALFTECKMNLEAAERKLGDMEENFLKNLESKDQTVAHLEQLVEELKTDHGLKAVQLTELINQITEKERLLKDQEDSHNKLNEEHEHAQESLEEYKAKLKVAERKVQEMTEELSKNILSRDHMVTDLEEMVESLQRDLEMKGDEISSLLEKISNIEVKLRLSNQKLRVTEQVLTEREESFRKAEAKHLEEQRILEERITTLSGLLSAAHEAYCGMISDISEDVNSTFDRLGAAVQTFGGKYQNYEQRIREISKELWTATNWIIEANQEKERLKKEVYILSEQLQNTKEQESMLIEKVEKLEVKVIGEEKQNEELSEAVKQLQRKIEALETSVKEKDEQILDLGEEKKEAIRQLCVWIDYFRNRYDHLKDRLSKMVAAGGRRPA